ncbi:type I DNA topoisomerase [Leptolyngbya sp. BC1307]|uniref:type I DNA topoisomerase n=1 Tax=Leptolyngbya sp. BC1307 TaxID=2029589 RepID=UPI000EFBD0AD|nr:type I DNA topoisomerase [Leptolyngbya sp. BC1307]
MSTLVIVESPTKAKTIRNYLPKGYRVEASMGHVRDLPKSAKEIPAKVKGEKWAQIGVNTEADFEPLYVIPQDKKKVVKTLKDALKDADELLLATDEDREGESISWHLLQVLKPKVPTKRMVFHEITREAIQAALSNCRTIDDKLVHAQETRRILDRLVGYTVSPLLWKKIAFGLSAGRVQSVSVRLLVERERARRAFRRGSYWDLKAALLKAKSPFDAKLVSVGGTRVANGSDFDEATGQVKAGRNVLLLNEQEARTLQSRLEQSAWSVANLEERPNTRKPAPPFTTSTLQQEANRKLGLSARDTMRTAQGLYEKGFITYMRTDSTSLSKQAIAAARSCVETKYGKEYLSPKPRQYATKSKGAQEAHEAIRPSGEVFRTPQNTALRERELRLYDLIWKRTVATQMAEARQTNITVQIEADDAIFKATGKRIDFPGFFRAYVEGSDDPDAAIENQEVVLPAMKQGDALDCAGLEAIGHETQPPARYTEASLVKTLEKEGIGRPSTYATVIGTIVERRYAELINNSLMPTFTAFAVIGLLEKNFPDLVDVHFTAKMEQTLDEISTGHAEWLPYLKNFYTGDAGLANQVEQQQSIIDPAEARTVDLEDLMAKVRIGRYGAYVEIERDDETVRASIPDGVSPADLDDEQVEVLLKQKTEGPEKVGLHPETGEPMYLLIGKYGPYVQLGDITEENKKPKRTSLPKGVKAEDVTQEMAVGLLSLPRTLGIHPESDNKVKASLGRFGPYVVHSKGREDGKDDYRSVKGDDDVLTISLERALEMLAQPKATRGRRAAKPIHEIGQHPVDEEPVSVYDGPYGPYIKHGKVNVSVPEGKKPEEVTLEEAVALLTEKGGTVKKKTTRKKSTAQSTTKKSTAKKSTAKKATSAKATAKKTSKSVGTKSADNKSEDNKSEGTKAKSARAKTTRTAAAKKTTKKSATEKVATEEA